MRFLLPLLATLLSPGAWASSHPGLPFMEYLDLEHLVCLKWGFDDLQENITFQLVVNTTGWVGFGFSPNGGMQGSDLVIGGLDSNGTYFTVRVQNNNIVIIVYFKFAKIIKSGWIH